MKIINELHIEKVALGGYGIGYHDGKAIFVPYTAIGDVVDVQVSRIRKDYMFAKPVNFVTRSPDIGSETCESFGEVNACGGCDWLMLDYSAQLRYKDNLLQELFGTVAAMPRPHSIVPSPEQRNYRNKVYMPVGKGKDGLAFGIFERWTHRIVPHTHCAINPPAFDTLALRTAQICAKAGVVPYDEAKHSGTLRHIGIRGNRDGSSLLLVLVTRGSKLPFSNLLVKQLTAEFPSLCGIIQNINRERGNVILGEEEKILHGVPYIFDELAGHRFRIHYRSFWQVNSFTADNIISAMAKMLRSGSTVIDAFSGCGAIGICLANKAKQVLCIEENEAATADGEDNAVLNDAANVGFICAKVEDALPALLVASPEGNPVLQEVPDCIVMDPPRAGVQKPALDAIISSGVKRVIYLSCSPMTLLRDIKYLCEAGAYTVKEIRPFDMFPQTWHIETLVMLDKADTASGD